VEPFVTDRITKLFERIHTLNGEAMKVMSFISLQKILQTFMSYVVMEHVLMVDVFTVDVVKLVVVKELVDKLLMLALDALTLE